MRNAGGAGSAKTEKGPAAAAAAAFGGCAEAWRLRPRRPPPLRPPAATPPAPPPFHVSYTARGRGGARNPSTPGARAGVQAHPTGPSSRSPGDAAEGAALLPTRSEAQAAAGFSGPVGAPRDAGAGSPRARRRAVTVAYVALLRHHVSGWEDGHHPSLMTKCRRKGKRSSSSRRRRRRRRKKKKKKKRKKTAPPIGAEGAQGQRTCMGRRPRRQLSAPSTGRARSPCPGARPHRPIRAGASGRKLPRLALPPIHTGLAAPALTASKSMDLGGLVVESGGGGGGGGGVAMMVDFAIRGWLYKCRSVK